MIKIDLEEKKGREMDPDCEKDSDSIPSTKVDKEGNVR